MRQAYKMLGSVAMICVATQAQADQDSGWFSVGPNVSSLGAGLEGDYRATDFIGGRLGFNLFKINVDLRSQDVRYNSDINLASVGGTVDLYPFAHSLRGRGFRLSAGLKWNGNDADLTATPAYAVTVGNTLYTPAQIGTLKGTVSVDPVSPYFGLGYSGRVGSDLYLAFDAGALYQGKSKASLNSSTGLVSQSDISAEQAKIQDKFDTFVFYPVITASLKYRF
jgi:hypothetical protein